MPADGPAVSAVVIFKDEERFLSEAVESVFSQTFEDWELLLVDDGSSDSSTTIAKRYATEHPQRVRYLEHPDHENLGMSASRNLGIENARGTYVASLDADDVWLPHKLHRQVEHLERRPAAAMVYGPLLRWRQWTGNPDAADHEDLMGVGRRKFGSHPLAGQVVDPPKLARLMLEDDYFIPGGALIRRQALNEVGRYEPEFRNMYEDAVTMLKIALEYPVLVTDEIGYLYRMHPGSHTHRTSSDEEIDRSRSAYLNWVEGYVNDHGFKSSGLRLALHRAKRSTHRKRVLRHRALAAGRTVGRHVLPRSVRQTMRERWREHTRPPVPGR